MSEQCAFCSLPEKRIQKGNSLAITFKDAYPVSPGHTLIVPRRHVASLFEVTEDERIALWDLLHWAQSDLRASLKPDGFNIGINDGIAAGQTVMHVHIHLIPRYAGDTADPRGGIRWIFPEKADYWSRR